MPAVRRELAAMAQAPGAAGVCVLNRALLTLVTCAGFWGAAGALLLMPAARGELAGVAATSLALGAAGLARGGFSVNHMDIAPQYAGVVMGISNTAGTLAGAAADSPENFCAHKHVLVAYIYGNECGRK